MTNLSFGIKTAPQRTTYQATLKVWQEADEGYKPALQARKTLEQLQNL